MVELHLLQKSVNDLLLLIRCVQTKKYVGQGNGSPGPEFKTTALNVQSVKVYKGYCYSYCLCMLLALCSPRLLISAVGTGLVQTESETPEQCLHCFLPCFSGPLVTLSDVWVGSNLTRPGNNAAEFCCSNVGKLFLKKHFVNKVTEVL